LTLSAHVVFGLVMGKLALWFWQWLRPHPIDGHPPA
jgi:hypothetical protein